MKRVLIFVFIVVVLAGIVITWIFLGPATGFKGSKETVYIRSNAATKKAVLDSLRSNKIISNTTAFEWLANRLDYWQHIRPGKYEVKKGTSLLTIVRMLRNGRQTPVHLVIKKYRTKEDFARSAGKQFEFDSTQMIGFLNDADSLHTYDADTATALWNVLPDTYTFFWNTTPSAVYKKIATTADAFWTPERKQKASSHGLTPLQAYILASVVEEETTNNEEKPNIASVYLNRMNKGMPLQADPTVKFALRDFSLKRIYEKYTLVQSPYNTYRNKGLPPGPICTPTRTTINAVLNAPQTNYLYFVASPSMKQEHEFSVSYEEHLQKAKRYQQELNKLDSERKQNGIPE